MKNNEEEEEEGNYKTERKRRRGKEVFGTRRRWIGHVDDAHGTKRRLLLRLMKW